MLSWVVDYTLGLGIVLYHTLIMAWTERQALAR